MPRNHSQMTPPTRTIIIKHHTNGKTRVAGTWRMEGGTVTCDDPGMFKIHCHRGLLANAPGGGTRQVRPEDGEAFMDALLDNYRSLTTAEEA